MHHLPQIFYDTLRPERPDCPVLIPSTFSVASDRIISQDTYSYEPCGLPTGDFMPAEQAQIRLMTASPVTLRALIPAPDQVTPEQAYFRDIISYAFPVARARNHITGIQGRAGPLRSGRLVQHVARSSTALPTAPSVPIQKMVQRERARSSTELRVL